MSLTQSGYAVIPKYGDPRIQLLTVAGVDIAPGVLRGDVHTILEWVAAQWNETVAPLKSGQCFGYAPRQIVGGTGWSNHASATAMDLNGADFPQGTYRMTDDQIAACVAIVVACENVVRWGGLYRPPTKIDQQHWEMNDNMAGNPIVARLANDIRTGKMATVDEILNHPFTVSDPFSVPTKKTISLRQLLLDAYNSARCAHRDTQAIRKHLGI